MSINHNRTLSSHNDRHVKRWSFVGFRRDDFFAIAGIGINAKKTVGAPEGKTKADVVFKCTVSLIHWYKPLGRYAEFKVQ